MGTAIAYLLSKNGQKNVTLWVRDAEKAFAINKLRENSEYVPGIILPDSVTATQNLVEALESSERIVFAVPSHAVQGLVDQIKGNINEKNSIILSVIKGLDYSSGLGLSHIICNSLSIPTDHFAVLSGPNFADELVGNTPSVMVIASKSSNTAFTFIRALESERLIVYPSDDVEGVEIASVLKNVIAIAIGIVDGLGFGANTRGAVFTVCVEEALRIGVTIFKAKPETILGPACLGDAITTGFSNKSRNYLLGLLLAKKASLGNSAGSFLCEGKNNIRLVKELAAKRELDVPITDFVYQIVNGDNAYSAFFTLWARLKSFKFSSGTSWRI